MQKERKIIKSATSLQKSLFEFKAFVRELPIEISKEQANKLTIKTAKNLIESFSHFSELMRLIKSLNPEKLSNFNDDSFRDIDRILGGLEAVIKIAEEQDGNSN
jgi:hypothetical protein